MVSFICLNVATKVAGTARWDIIRRVSLIKKSDRSFVFEDASRHGDTVQGPVSPLSACSFQSYCRAAASRSFRVGTRVSVRVYENGLHRSHIIKSEAELEALVSETVVDLIV